MLNTNSVIRMVLNGDTARFEDIIEEYYKAVYKVCYGFMHNEHDAKDMTQDVFVKIYEKLDKFNYKCEFSTWIYRISANTCINYLNKNKRIDLYGSVNDDFHSCNAFSPHQITEDNELFEILENEFNKMDINTARIIKLRIKYQMKFEDISKKLNIAASTVRSKFHRAKGKMINVIINYEKED